MKGTDMRMMRWILGVSRPEAASVCKKIRVWNESEDLRGIPKMRWKDVLMKELDVTLAILGRNQRQK